MKKNTLPEIHIRKKYSEIYGTKEKIDLKNITNLYQLNNKAGMSLLGSIILYENELKEKLADFMKEEEYFKYFKQWLNKNKKDNQSVNKGLIKLWNKKDEWNLNDFCDELTFGQLRAIIKGINLKNEFGKFTELSNSVMTKLKTLNVFRNHIAHGKEIKSQIKIKYPGGSEVEYKLVKVLKILFKKYPNFKIELDNLLTEYNFYKINIDPTKILVHLKIQGLFNIGSLNKIIDSDGFYEFYLGRNFEKINKKDKIIKKIFAELFGKTKYKSIYKENTKINKTNGANFIKWYKKFLVYKEDHEIINKTEAIILLILNKVQKTQIRQREITNIIKTSYIDNQRVKKICRSFKIKIEKEKLYDFNGREMKKNFLLISGYSLYKENYLINRKKDVIKLTSNYPFYKKVKISNRENNNGNRCKQVSINGKGVKLHRICAELFIDNPKKYRYVGSKNGDFLNYRISDLEWIEYPAKPRVTERLRKKSWS